MQNLKKILLGQLCRQATSFFVVPVQPLSTSNYLAKKRQKNIKKITLSNDELNSVIDFDKFKRNMTDVVNRLKMDLDKKLPLRLDTNVLENFNVKIGNKLEKLGNFSSINKFDEKTIVVDMNSFPQYIPEVVRSIENSSLSVHPQQDKTSIFIPVQRLTREHRLRLSGNAKNLADKAIVDLRTQHNSFHKQIRRKEKEESKDLIFALNNLIKDEMTEYVKKVNEELMKSQKKILLVDTK
ncbi:hypothetical protein SNEBB_000803 [Seison nebaliae]|nr:hypothetical protein SNEBB_000803 [Seison nebaliae]